MVSSRKGPKIKTEDDLSYARRMGERLRKVRQQQRLSLHDVEASSRREFTASALSAYERGERAVSVLRLQRLSAFYRAPIRHLLPGGDEEEWRDLEPEGREKLTIDLSRLEQASQASPDWEPLRRYLAQIQVARQDFARVLSIREADLATVSCLLGVDPAHVPARLADVRVAS